MNEPDPPADGSPADARAATAVEIRDLTLRAGHRLLLERANARFEPGQITLVVGASGAGKSLLLRLLAGLIAPDDPDIKFEGQVEVGDRSGAAVGVVFQSFALFDELSPLDNVRFAYDHRPQATPIHQDGKPSLAPERLLDELHVPADVRTASLSGGQRQRLAIARTLAYDPHIVLYDEPTSGLDAVTAAQAAKLIHATHQAHGKTSIIVTHDDRAMTPIADRIYLFDPHAHGLRLVEREDWPRLQELITPPVIDEVAPGPGDSAKPSGWWQPASRRVGSFLEGVSRMVEQAAWLPVRLVPRWRSPAWGLRFLLHYLRLVADPSAWLYIALAGAIVGFVSTYFTFRFLPFSSYTEPLIIEDMLAALGFALYRVFVPLLATVLVAARCGAAVSSDVGAKVYGHQIDALRTFDAEPRRYILTNILYAFLGGTVWLVAIGFVTSRLTSLVVFTATHPHFGPFFWESHFHSELRQPDLWIYRGTGWLVAKLLVCAAGTGLIAYARGARPKHSSTDVSLGITSTVLWTTLYVLVVHLGFALFEFEEIK
jgi:ABC-type transporter Mla maintaining outer membrane lipid asymmetry ATPase subunit MlaF/ABC-type transporter Mla maintaining outer membrane lipid asymmetry permease subunit MlaE